MDSFNLNDLEDAMRGFPNDIKLDKDSYIDKLASLLRQTLFEDDSQKFEDIHPSNKKAWRNKAEIFISLIGNK